MTIPAFTDMKSFVKFLATLNLKETKSVNEYKDILLSLNSTFGDFDYVKKIINETDFLSAPASTKYHGDFKSGLVQHSLLTAYHFCKLICTELGNSDYIKDFSIADLFYTALFHDLCKADMYETSFRNQKDANDKWVKVPYYTVREDYTALGHGVESAMRLVRYEPRWASKEMYPLFQAVYWHMGFTDVSTTEEPQYHKALVTNPLVLLLYTADEMAAFWDKV